MSDEAPDYADDLLFQMLVDYVAEGTTFIDACRLLGLARSTVYRHVANSERASAALEKAREDGYECLANDVLAIIDDTDNDYVGGVDRLGRPKIFLNKEHVQRSKLRAEMRLKLLAKWHPKKYGEKLQVETKSAPVAIPVGDDPIAAQLAYETLMRG